MKISHTIRHADDVSSGVLVELHKALTQLNRLIAQLGNLRLHRFTTVAQRSSIEANNVLKTGAQFGLNPVTGDLSGCFGTRSASLNWSNRNDVIISLSRRDESFF